MKQRVMLVLVDTDKVPIAADVLGSPSCATCKWAVGRADYGKGIAGYAIGANLTCTREEAADDGEAPPALFTTYTGPMQVAPTFGCVQWEGK